MQDEYFCELTYARLCYTIYIMTKIAIIEDDQTISQMYRMKFEAEGFDVQLADNGLRGVALVTAFRPDLVLLDLQMPEMDGVEALTEIRKNDKFKDLPVIILTNMGQEESSDKLKSLNVDSYIVKADLTPSQVVNKVKTTLGL